MKTIVVSGACSNVGKTTLANELRELLPGAVVVKLGHGRKREGKNENFLSEDTAFAEIESRHGDAPFLILESNSILDRMSPDLVLFLDGPERKPSAARAVSIADIVSGRRAAPDRLETLARKLDVATDVMTRIAWLSGARPEPVAAVILAGGKSSRMGSDKARLEIDGITIVERLYGQLQPHFDEVLIGVAREGDALIPGVRHVADAEPDRGPLMGIHSALSVSDCRVNFVTACDVPEIDVGLIRKLLSCTVSCDVAVPTFGEGRPEPLLAVYCREVLPHVAAMLEEGNLRVRDLFTRCRAQIVEFSSSDWYVNLNDPEEYRRYVARLDAREGNQ